MVGSTRRRPRSSVSEFTRSKGKNAAERRRQELVKHLETALRVEHATIPPYFFALCSIKDGANPVAAGLLRAVVIEEMLHMVLVANVLNAITNGYRFELYRNDFMPDYPAPLPGSNECFKVYLRPFSEAAIENFIQIERPGDEEDPQHSEYATIGQFYAAIKDEIDRYCEDYDEDTLFIGHSSRQVDSQYYYNGGGEIVQVCDKATARFAIKVIVDEGEGFSESIFSGDHANFGERPDPAHYYKFREILHQRKYRPEDRPNEGPTGNRFPVDYSDQSVYPVIVRKLAELTEHRDTVETCNAAYWEIVRCCEDAFNGKQERLEAAIHAMYETKYLTQDLMRVGIGPAFEFPSESAT